MTMQQGSSGTITAIPIGAAVFTVEGEQFARVKAVRGGYFELDVPMADDFWLSSVYVAGVRENEVHLGIGESEVGAHRLAAPGIETGRSATAADRVIGNEQALSQRERMERELAAQRERMGIQPEASTGARVERISADEAEEIDEAARDAEREAKRAEMLLQRDAGLGGRLPQ